ncbi:surface presentation of antigens protein SpaP [Yersinia enterocolitica]|nr:surface presentation of antigens protein SpaP [Yersinia enterocolitica]VTP82869.1 surface presentation of antigens protein SpaP [Yersinia enterocolitica subsp. enterocolitica]CNF64424.1 surface presentation of antigens protein SpaP [Yersinia enterocolitica]CNF72083.1 surface presentation of antigens protein SpaP [Yersinia enterocolitica]CNJ57317.1 surface presentation of antigens protein SpaP [Yersinia enterocolitica]
MPGQPGVITMMPTLPGDIPLLAIVAFSSLLPFVIAAGTCYLKISIVLIMVRNAMGVQQVPSGLALNGIALLLSLFVMMPVIQDVNHYMRTEKVDFSNVDSVDKFIDGGLGSYTAYLKKYSDPELLNFFESLQQGRSEEESMAEADTREPALFSLLPAYALSEIKSAFEIGFYIYLPFVVIDLIISSILLALGMMMMSPVTISVPVKLILFVAIDGWALISKGLIMQYMELAQH